MRYLHKYLSYKKRVMTKGYDSEIKVYIYKLKILQSVILKRTTGFVLYFHIKSIRNSIQ